ncbi:MAG TPA: DUF4038 domain-containing protein [Candidatus Acidoferrum sp.]|nr:DUF4038 domain-containing protein [Candidatus Acidoferrum sp.]
MEIAASNGMKGHAGPMTDVQSEQLVARLDIFQDKLKNHGVTDTNLDFASLWNAIYPANPLSSYLEGKDPLTGGATWGAHRTARQTPTGAVINAFSAVDIALWDLRGKVMNQPVYKLLGGTRNSVPIYASFWANTPAAALAAATNAYATFHQIKTFPPKRPSDGAAGLQANLDIAAAMRNGLPADAEISFDLSRLNDEVDASPATRAERLEWACEMVKGFEQYRPKWVEEPVGPDDIEGFAAIRKAAPNVKISAGEHLYTRWNLKPYLDRRLLDIVQVDPEWGGGISELVEICKMIQQSYPNVLVFPHGHEYLAAAHILASQPLSVIGKLEDNKGPRSSEMMYFTNGGLAWTSNTLVMPAAPGLGLDLDPARYKVIKTYLGKALSDATPPTHVWEKVEISLRAQTAHANPYTDVLVWVDLKGPGFDKRCYGFWDGQDNFRVRVMATAPGNWSWKSGSKPADPELDGLTGSFTAVAWTEGEKEANLCRRGMIGPSANGRAFQHADGTPYFLLGDTWWATPTFRFRWRDEDTLRPLGPAAGFKEFVALRRSQQFNCVAILAALPNWANDDQPANLQTADGTLLRSAWGQAGTASAKTMTDEAGNRAFLFPGKVPGYEQYFPDLQRINPAYFQAMDKKIDYLNSQGLVPFIEVARRDIGQAWKKYYPWPDSYSRYIQYVWSRYQANICLFSPIHFDSSGGTIPAADWNEAANQVTDDYGPPPFGTLAGTNPDGSSLKNWGHVKQARWLGFHQIGNRRTHDSYALLTEIFKTTPPVPAINGEPYYDGMENAEGGTERAALYCRSAMYGSVLSGGFGGHIYGAGGWSGGIWSGEVEEASKYPMWKVFQWPSAGQLRHLKSFMLSEGPRYQELVPCAESISPNQSGNAKGMVGWAYAAATPQRDLFLLYLEKECPQAALSTARPGGHYQARWFDPRTGRWSDAAIQPATADASGRIALPPYPDGASPAQNDWALKLTLIANR